jgi:hypothetical protein
VKPPLRVIRLAALLLPLALATGGCGPSIRANGSAAPSASTGSMPPQAPSGSGPAASIAPGATTPVPGASVGALVEVDPGLLRILPARIDGVALEPDPTTAAQIATDSTVGESAEAIAVALAIRPGTSTGDDLAIVSVIRLRPGVFSEGWFTDWRATYDQAACDVAGGVEGPPSQTSIAGRTVYVGTCAGDAQTYHVHLADPSLIVSITGAGTARFGELVVAGLAE